MARMFYDYVSDGIVSIDEHRKIYYVNKEGLRMLGREFEDLGGLEFDEAVLLQNYNGQVVKFEELPEDPEFFWVVRGDRTLFSARVMVFTHESGRKDVLIVDVSEERNIEGQKNDFIALISHQLRTPANIIAWYAEMLENEKHGPINSKQHKLINQIQSGSRRLSDLMSSIVNAARYDLNRIKLKEQHFDIVDLVRHLARQKKPEAEEMELTVDFEVSDDIDAVVVSDKEYLSIVLKAVLDNAIRYNEKGGTVHVKISETRFALPGQVSVEGFEIAVRDSGIGIPARQRYDVFNKLFRADNAQRTGEAGLGLGLYLAKKYIDQLGGTIHFESAPGEGTTFYMNLPKVMDEDILQKNRGKV